MEEACYSKELSNIKQLFNELCLKTEAAQILTRINFSL